MYVKMYACMYFCIYVFHACVFMHTTNACTNYTTLDIKVRKYLYSQIMIPDSFMVSPILHTASGFDPEA